jgi:tetratricopeptide (TPR) repeat protein
MTNPELILHFARLKTGSDDPVPVPVHVRFDGAESETFDFVNPLSDKDLKDLRWYLEAYWVWPSEIDDKRAREIEGRLPQWGKALFDAVFSRSSAAMRLFGRFDDDHAAGRRLTIDSNEPRILRLPWELLRDEGGYLFSKNPPVSVLRRMKQTRRTRIGAFEPPVRILMVTCRPDGAGWIDPRSIATPLLAALEGIPEQVAVEFLRPPTLAALDRRLRDPDQPRVHIVHFDGHGVYDPGVGLGFLLFEDEQHQEHLVDAEQLGTLLNESGIPLMVLNACQSAQPDERNPFGSVAARLIESGVGGVVAMNYSVLVETAKRFTAEFYGALARGASAGSAMDATRRGLFRDSKRLTRHRPAVEQATILHLQDWFLPALYQQAEELVPFQQEDLHRKDAKNAMKSKRKKESPSDLEKQPVPSDLSSRPSRLRGANSGFPPPPLPGFHGRARELLDLERGFATRSIVVLHGFGGQGKTALATQTAEWFTRTGLFARAAFFSFESGASLEYVINELGSALVQENFQIYSGDKAAAIAQALRERATLLVFDNFESALPQGNAPMPDLQALLDTAAGWLGSTPTPGGSRLLVTTRNPEIPHPAFTPGRACLLYELSGLADDDALDLAAAILEANSLPRPPRAALEKLLRFLDGHPLSLQLALPQLRRYTAEELVAEYQAILPQMKVGAGQERNESLQVSLKFSLDRLGADAWTWLSRLAIFEGGAMEHILLEITEIPAETWQALKPQLIATALVRSEDIPGVSVPFIHFHPTLAPYLRGLEDGTESADASPAAQAPMRERYWRAYYAFAGYLYRADNQYPFQARAMALRELPNLKCALQQALAAGTLEEAVVFVTSINRFLNYFGRWREHDELAAQVEQAVKTRGRATQGRITQSETMQEIGRGERLLQQGRAGEAERVFRALLARLEGAAAYDTRYDQSLTLLWLGRYLRAQGRPAEARDCHSRALKLAQGLEQTQNVRNHIGVCHTEIANALCDLGQYTQAREQYEKALAIAQQEGNERSVGVKIGQIGNLAFMQGDLNEARKHHGDALKLFQSLGEDEMQAVAWHQLGMVAQEAHDWDEAERCYKQSLAIEERLGNLKGVTQTCNQLAIVAENAGRPQEAERWYLREIEIDEKLENPKELATDYNNLAGLYLQQNRLAEAETYIRRSLDIKKTLDLSFGPWNNYNILTQIAQKRGRAAEARDWRRKEQEARLAFEAGSQADTSSALRQQVDQWNNVIADILKVCQSGAPDAELEAFLDQMAGEEDWKALIAALRRILGGERGLELFDDLDDVESAIVRRVLKGLMQAGKAHTPPDGGQRGEGEGLTLPQLLDLVERAAGGDRQLGEQLFAAFQQMAQSGDSTLSALGGVLLRVLLGERNPPNLDSLPEEVASAIRGLLGRLKNKE